MMNPAGFYAVDLLRTIAKEIRAVPNTADQPRGARARAEALASHVERIAAALAETPESAYPAVHPSYGERPKAA